MARDWFNNCVPFSSSVIRLTRSAARCSAGKLVSKYAAFGSAAFCAFCAPATYNPPQHANPAATIRNPTIFIAFLTGGLNRSRFFVVVKRSSALSLPTLMPLGSGCQAGLGSDFFPMKNRFISIEDPSRFWPSAEAGSARSSPFAAVQVAGWM
jgi:hypothetical protein